MTLLAIPDSHGGTLRGFKMGLGAWRILGFLPNEHLMHHRNYHFHSHCFPHLVWLPSFFSVTLWALTGCSHIQLALRGTTGDAKDSPVGPSSRAWASAENDGQPHSASSRRSCGWLCGRMAHSDWPYTENFQKKSLDIVLSPDWIPVWFPIWATSSSLLHLGQIMELRVFSIRHIQHWHQ